MLVIASDIFGCTPELIECANQLAHSNYHLVSPYSPGQYFDDESHGYDAFIQQGGIDGYIQKLTHAIAAISKPVDLLGFSAGGAAAFYVCATEIAHSVRKSWCFYPGQVRHYTHMIPQVSCRITFASNEAHFDVSEVMTALGEKPNLNLATCEFSHGFMNRRSMGFDEMGYQDYLRKIRQWLEK